MPGGGIEPPTRGFSIHCSTPELPGHGEREGLALGSGVVDARNEGVQRDLSVLRRFPPREETTGASPKTCPMVLPPLRDSSSLTARTDGTTGRPKHLSSFAAVASLPLRAACGSPKPGVVTQCAFVTSASGGQTTVYGRPLSVISPGEDGTQAGADAINACIERKHLSRKG